MFTIIAAIGKNNEIGKNNALIWYLPNDLKFFQQTTQNSKIVMGRKTFESLPRKLKNREYFIITNNKNFYVEDATIITDVYAFIEQNKDTEEEIFIIGGSSIYKLFLPYAKKMFITKIYMEDKNADSYFPIFEEKHWNKTTLSQNTENNIRYDHILYEHTTI